MIQKYDAVDSCFEAYDLLSDDEKRKSEMTRDQAGFLCGLIKTFRPRKVLEVGVAAGSTTLILSYILNSLKNDAEMFCVDISNDVYYLPGKETGYICKERLTDSSNMKMPQFFLGKFLPERISEIGSNIDFVILDTVHHVPGEILDFLAILPYLSDNAIVVLHDIILEHENRFVDKDAYVNQVLFSSVTGVKFLNFDNTYYPNIAAFQVGSDTKKNIMDVFASLTLRWSYIPSLHELEIYRKAYRELYPDEVNMIFENAVRLNTMSHKKMDRNCKDYLLSLSNSIFINFRSIYFYGAGKRGKALNLAFKMLNYKDVGKIHYLVSDSEDGATKWSDLDGVDREEFLIILTAKAHDIRERLEHANYHWIDIPEWVWSRLEMISEE